MNERMPSPSPVRRRVVLVEDDESVGVATVEALMAQGYMVTWCRDGETAAARLAPTPPDLVLLDAGLPDIGGFSICHWLRHLYRDLPIVLLAARDAEIDIVAVRGVGARLDAP